MYIIGLHGNTGNISHTGVHDASYSIADLDTKTIVHLVEIEKLTGIKHDGNISLELLKNDLGNILNSNFEIATSHFTIFENNNAPREFPFLKKTETLDFNNLSYCSDKHISLFGRQIKNYLYIHELAHVFTSFMFRQKDYEKFLGLVIEGCGSFAQSSLFIVDGYRVELLEYNLPLISGNFFQQWLPKVIFDAGSDNYTIRSATPGKVMALAGYGNPDKYYDLLLRAYKRKHRDHEYLNYNDNFCPEIETQNLSWKDRIDLCAAGQKIFQDLIVEQAVAISSKYGKLPLYYSGGCALSIKANSQLREIFEDLIIPPNCSDIGEGLGLAAMHAFLAYHIRLNPLNPASTLISDNNSETDIRGNLSNEKIEKVAELLTENEIIAFVQGGPEIGPRALCHRSIIASPGSYEMREIFNHIKQREYYRPVAPIVLDSFGDRIFQGYHYSPFMLFDFFVKEDFKSIIPACVHVDQTARVQSIPDGESDISKILKKFSSFSGLPPVLMNTSLNSRGKPIASTKEQVIAEVKNLKIKFLVLGDQLIEY